MLGRLGVVLRLRTAPLSASTIRWSSHFTHSVNDRRSATMQIIHVLLLHNDYLNLPTRLIGGRSVKVYWPGPRSENGAIYRSDSLTRAAGTQRFHVDIIIIDHDDGRGFSRAKHVVPIMRPRTIILTRAKHFPKSQYRKLGYHQFCTPEELQDRIESFSNSG